MNEFFYSLTPDAVINAIEQSGLKPSGHYMVLNSYENRVYDLMLEDESHIIAKFYRPGRWTREQILEEHAFLIELSENEIPVCSPVPFPDGSTLHSFEDINFAIWIRTGGRVKDELTDADLRNLGRLIARIHNCGASKKAPNRLTLSPENFVLKPMAFINGNNLLPSHCREQYIKTAEEIASIYDSLLKDVPLHRIHGDCHIGNLLHGRDGWFFLDFDDFVNGPAVQDIWMLAPAMDSEGSRQRDVLLEGYREFRDFENSWLHLVEVLRAVRYIHYAAWIARRWEDPAFPEIFPHFGTDRYWEDETSDLAKQLKLIKKNLQGQSAPAEPEMELTNKDFFWDME